MLTSVRALHHYAIQASDGAIGRVEDTLFDDYHWTVRYLVVDTGGWLNGRRVLVSPIAVAAIDWQANAIDVELTTRQVEGSPDISADPPLAEQMEAEYASYYDYQPYWEGTGVWGLGMYPRPWLMGMTGMIPTAQADGAATPTADNTAQDAPGARYDRHLRSVNEIKGYAIEATDGTLGHVEDILMDDESWTVRYMVVATGSWWHGKSVLIAPAWIREFDWGSALARVDLQREVIKSAPPYDPSRRVGRPYEERLYAHYGQPHYWVDRPHTGSA